MTTRARNSRSPCSRRCGRGLPLAGSSSRSRRTRCWGHTLGELHRYTNRRGDHAAPRRLSRGGRHLALPGRPDPVHGPDDKHWAGLVRLLGSPPELSDPAWADPAERRQRAEEIMALVGPAILAMSREDFVARGQELSVPCALVNTIGQFTQDPQPRSRGFFVRAPVAALGEFDVPGQPFVSGQPLLAQYRRPAPRLGEHDPAAIAREWRVGATAGTDRRPPAVRDQGDFLRHGHRGRAVRHGPGRAGGRRHQDRVPHRARHHAPAAPGRVGDARAVRRGNVLRHSPTSTGRSGAWRWT